MKKQTLLLITVILSVFFLAGCSYGEQSSKKVETEDISTVKVGKYLGQPYRITSSFIPILTLENNDRFRLELGIGKSIEGTYKVENNKVVLTSSDGGENYTLNISDNILVIEQELPSYVKRGTNFKLPASE